MTFQLSRTHMSIVAAATTVAASFVVIPALAENGAPPADAVCPALLAAHGRIDSEYNPALSAYADAVAAETAARNTANGGTTATEAQLRQTLADAQAALEAAKAAPAPTAQPTATQPAAEPSRGIGWVDWSKVDHSTQAQVIEALIVQKMNAYRANAGLPPLVVSDTLTTDSRAWSKHMAVDNDFNHDPEFRYLGSQSLDGASTNYAGENIAYNSMRNFGAQLGARGNEYKTPDQAASDLFEQWKNSQGHDKNMLAENNVVGVGVHIGDLADGGLTVWGTQKFYAISDKGSIDLSRFHTTGDTASAYGFDGAAFNADNTDYVSGLAGDGVKQKQAAWTTIVGDLPAQALPVAPSSLPAKDGASPSPAPSTTPDPAPTADGSAVAQAQAAVDAAQKALDDFLADPQSAYSQAVENLKAATAALDGIAESIGSQTGVRPQPDGGVVVSTPNTNSSYYPVEAYRKKLAACLATTGQQRPVGPAQSGATGAPAAPASVAQQSNAPAGPAPSEQSSAAPSPAASQQSSPAAGSDGNGGQTVSTEAGGAGPGAANGANNGGGAPGAADKGAATGARAANLASTGSMTLVLGIGALIVLGIGVGAMLVAKRRKGK